jgi:hypothetical protein
MGVRLLAATVKAPGTETTGTGSEAPAGRGAATSPSDVGFAAVTEGNTSRPPEDVEDMVAHINGGCCRC